ncbi:MAG: hypothetical protein KF851_08145 [Pirellulaceae bacterium]|nr:hypothetical protein [Pirellulaceae bacterium]
MLFIKHQRLFLSGLLFAVLLIVLGAQTAWAQDKNQGGRQGTDRQGTERQPPARGSTDRKDDGGTGNQRGRSSMAGRMAEMEKVRNERALEFVKEHHPQVLRLMNALEKNNAAQYRQALGSLAMEVDRLNMVKQRDSDRYPNALEMWKNQKSIDIVSAQIATQAETDELRQRMRELLQQRRELSVANLELDIKVAEARLARLERVKAEMAEDDPNLESRIDQMIQRAKRSSQNSPARPGFNRGFGRQKNDSDKDKDKDNENDND